MQPLASKVHVEKEIVERGTAVPEFQTSGSRPISSKIGKWSKTRRAITLPRDSYAHKVPTEVAPTVTRNQRLHRLRRGRPRSIPTPHRLNRGRRREVRVISLPGEGVGTEVAQRHRAPQRRADLRVVPPGSLLQPLGSARRIRSAFLSLVATLAKRRRRTRLVIVSIGHSLIQKSLHDTGMNRPLRERARPCPIPGPLLRPPRPLRMSKLREVKSHRGARKARAREAKVKARGRSRVGIGLTRNLAPLALIVDSRRSRRVIRDPGAVGLAA